MARNAEKKRQTLRVKERLIEQLKKEKAFWSYSPESVSAESVSDDMLIAFTLRFLDIDEINLLFTVFSAKAIKGVWRSMLVPEGEYLYTLNRFLAWYYFGAKNPDAYLKSLQTRHINKLLNEGSH